MPSLSSSPPLLSRMAPETRERRAHTLTDGAKMGLNESGVRPASRTADSLLASSPSSDPATPFYRRRPWLFLPIEHAQGGLVEELLVHDASCLLTVVCALVDEVGDRLETRAQCVLLVCC